MDWPDPADATPRADQLVCGFHAIGGREVHVSVVGGSKYCPLS
jgi:hypothetical protein